MLAISFAYGIFHAAGPGHGKAVISSYLVANQETARRGIALSFASALMQSLVAVVIVAVCAWLLNATAKTMCGAEKAVARFKRREAWWEMPDGITKIEQEARRQTDDWEQILCDYLVGRFETTIRDLAVECLRIEISHLDNQTQRRIGAALRAIGWEKQDARRDGRVVKVWFRKEDDEQQRGDT